MDTKRANAYLLSHRDKGTYSVEERYWVLSGNNKKRCLDVLDYDRQEGQKFSQLSVVSSHNLLTMYRRRAKSRTSQLQPENYTDFFNCQQNRSQPSVAGRDQFARSPIPPCFAVRRSLDGGCTGAPVMHRSSKCESGQMIRLPNDRKQRIVEEQLDRTRRRWAKNRMVPGLEQRRQFIGQLLYSPAPPLQPTQCPNSEIFPLFMGFAKLSGRVQTKSVWSSLVKEIYLLGSLRTLFGVEAVAKGHPALSVVVWSTERQDVCEFGCWSEKRLQRQTFSKPRVCQRVCPRAPNAKLCFKQQLYTFDKAVIRLMNFDQQQQTQTIRYVCMPNLPHDHRTTNKNVFESRTIISEEKIERTFISSSDDKSSGFALLERKSGQINVTEGRKTMDLVDDKREIYQDDRGQQLLRVQSGRTQMQCTRRSDAGTVRMREERSAHWETGRKRKINVGRSESCTNYRRTLKAKRSKSTVIGNK